MLGKDPAIEAGGDALGFESQKLASPSRGLPGHT